VQLKKGGILNNNVPLFPQDTFASCLNHLCPYFTMLQELQNFGRELNCSSEVENCTKCPPNTLIAYWAVAKEFLNDFNMFIIQIESEVKKQGMYHVLNIFAYIIHCPFVIQ
jgi:hypothetical protein